MRALLRPSVAILLVFCAVFSFRSPPAYAGGGYSIVFPTDNVFDGDTTKDPASHLYGVIQYRLPTTEELLQAFLMFYKYQSVEQISDEFLKAELKNRITADAVALIAVDIVIDAMIDLTVEILKQNNWYGLRMDEFTFRQLAVTVKSLATAYFDPVSVTVSFVSDTVKLQAESWKETKQALDLLPVEGTLPEEYTELIFGFTLYDLKGVVDTYDSVVDFFDWRN